LEEKLRALFTARMAMAKDEDYREEVERLSWSLRLVDYEERTK
jgi:hypothetical protein